MEALSDTKWDVVISGTGFLQSLFALAVSRSGKKILHIDANNYYGGAEAALSLQEAEEWAERHCADKDDAVFKAAQIVKESQGLSFSRAYSIALAPQLIHSRSKLLSQLVSSKAFRHIEFLSVGSFYVLQPASASRPNLILSRIHSTREDVFLDKAISPRSKRSLMKLLKFVLDYDSELQQPVWKPHANEALVEFLASVFNLDHELQSYVVTLTLSLDAKVTVEEGLAAIHRHLTSMGVFGPGFAAVYPKWGGLSEIAQVGCRACAVGGATYILGTDVTSVQTVASTGEEANELHIALANDIVVRAKTLIQGANKLRHETVTISRMAVIINSPLSALFKPSMEAAPTPCLSVVAFPSGSVLDSTGHRSEVPIYASLHSSDTGECPVGQCIIYFTTIASPQSRALLDAALDSLLSVLTSDHELLKCLFKMQYEQKGSTGSLIVEESVATFAPQPLGLAFQDSVLASVEKAWNMLAPSEGASNAGYMVFEDREGAIDDEDSYDL
ncbi:hypothetical protein CDD81_5102 [Ophiocordyceps australis]|uniref:Rab proteins geranylgeranyltransferase n=1 Tax=Ophiocordyceps australis TaxID=1399860 RepID=A0A2C5Y5M3_9HYPO|nr:hypothetical protein CDD81_5102 [Ophiocordyceps australis]